jgi:hypothetical protein
VSLVSRACNSIDIVQNLLFADPEDRFAVNIRSMTKNKKKVKQMEVSKTKKMERTNDPDQIIYRIEEDTRVLKGIISRFNKPVQKDEDE